MCALDLRKYMKDGRVADRLMLVRGNRSCGRALVYNLCYLSRERDYKGPVNISYVLKWIGSVTWEMSDAVVYDRILTHICRGTGTVCLSDRGWRIASYSNQTEKMLTTDAKLVAASFGDKKCLRILALDTKAPVDATLTGWSSYEETRSYGLTLYVKYEKLNVAFPKGGVYLAGNIIDVEDKLSVSAAAVGRIVVDFEELAEKLAEFRIIGSENDIAELTKRHPCLANACETVEISMAAVTNIEGGDIMNMIAGGDVVNTQAVNEELPKICRAAFLATLGFDNDVFNSSPGWIWRKQVADKDYLLGAMNRISKSDVGKIDIYAVADVEGERLYFTSAGFIYGASAEDDSYYRIIPFSDFGKFLREELGIDEYVAGGGSGEKSLQECYPFSFCYAFLRSAFETEATEEYSAVKNRGFGSGRGYLLPTVEQFLTKSGVNAREAAKSVKKRSDYVRKHMDYPTFASSLRLLERGCKYDYNIGKYVYPNNGAWQEHMRKMLTLFTGIESVNQKYGFTLVSDLVGTRKALMSE